MWTLIPVSLALIINFYSPEIPETKIKNNYVKNETITGFPYHYFKKEVFTYEMVEFRVRLIYIFSMILFFPLVQWSDKLHSFQQQHL